MEIRGIDFRFHSWELTWTAGWLAGWLTCDESGEPGRSLVSLLRDKLQSNRFSFGWSYHIAQVNHSNSARSRRELNAAKGNDEDDHYDDDDGGGDQLEA